MLSFKWKCTQSPHNLHVTTHVHEPRALSGPPAGLCPPAWVLGSIPFPRGTVRARAAVRIHALGAEPRLEFLYLRQSRSAGHRDAAGSVGTAHLLPHLKRCLTTNGDRGERLKHFPGASDLLVRQLGAVCPKAP